MSDGYLGEIRMFSGNFAPRGWANCDGTLLSVSQYPDLFNVIRNFYGGDGTTTFALPDMRGRVPIQTGVGQGIPSHIIAESFGSETVTLTTDELPTHTHAWQAVSTPAAGAAPQNAALASPQSNYYTNDSRKIVKMNESAVGNTGGQQPHNNMMSSLAIRFIICLNGTNPQQS